MTVTALAASPADPNRRRARTSNAAAVCAYRHGLRYAVELGPYDLAGSFEQTVADLVARHSRGVEHWFLRGVRDQITAQVVTGKTVAA